jgi:hypothetical protein
MRFGIKSTNKLLVLSVIIVLALSSISMIGSHNFRTAHSPRAIVQPPVVPGPDPVCFERYKFSGGRWDRWNSDGSSVSQREFWRRKLDP